MLIAYVLSRLDRIVDWKQKENYRYKDFVPPVYILYCPNQQVWILWLVVSVVVVVAVVGASDGPSWLCTCTRVVASL